MDQEITGKYLIKNSKPHFCMVPDDPVVGDLWWCACGKYHLAVDDPWGLPFREISKWRAMRLLRKNGR